MNLIDEKHISFIKGSKKAGKVTRLVKYRAGSHFHIDAKLICNDMRKGCLSQTRRAMEKYMVQRLPSHFGSRHKYLEIGYDLVLAREFLQVLRTYYSVQILIFAFVDVVRVEIFHHENQNYIIQIY